MEQPHKKAFGIGDLARAFISPVISLGRAFVRAHEESHRQMMEVVKDRPPEEQAAYFASMHPRRF